MDKKILAGKIGAPHGVRGSVKVFSYTTPAENLLNYQPWWLEIKGEVREVKIQRSQVHNDVLLVDFEGVADRDQAALLTHGKIYIQRQQLPNLAQGEYYWTDLEGLTVKNEAGFTFGLITHLMETGANDVMFIKGDKEYCIPYLPERVVKNVDLNKRVMLVDWPADLE